jgi:hypothetical protein
LECSPNGRARPKPPALAGILALVLDRPHKRRQRSIQRIPPLKLVMKSPLRNPIPSIRRQEIATGIDTFGFADVQNHMQQVGANTVITYDAADVITLLGVNTSSLHASDFQFV